MAIQIFFEPIDFQQMNEADVREEILAPLLRRLGYRSGTTNNIIREQPLSLRYPRAFLGRKNPNKDPLLRGKADYICEVEGPIRWIIESKPPNAEISIDDIEQAYTYANHPEIRAALFCICNGYELRVYQTNLGPDATARLCVPYSVFNERFDEIENLLSPASIRREFPTCIVDTGKPLGPGLRSIARITGGYIKYTENNLNLPTLRNMIVAVTGGSVERNENAQMIASVRGLSHFESFQKLNEKLGLDYIEAISRDDSVSTDPHNPTRFVSTRRITIPQGEKILNLLTWKEVVTPSNIIFDTETIAEGVLKKQVFSGKFYLKVVISGLPKPLETGGEFVLHIA
jgi:hypothetical protein